MWKEWGIQRPKESYWTTGAREDLGGRGFEFSFKRSDVPPLGRQHCHPQSPWARRQVWVHSPLPPLYHLPAPNPLPLSATYKMCRPTFYHFLSLPCFLLPQPLSSGLFLSGPSTLLPRAPSKAHSYSLSPPSQSFSPCEMSPAHPVSPLSLCLPSFWSVPCLVSPAPFAWNSPPPPHPLSSYTCFPVNSSSSLKTHPFLHLFFSSP